MILFITLRRKAIFYMILGAFLIISLLFITYKFTSATTCVFNNDEVSKELQQMFYIRNKAIMQRDTELIQSLYDIEKTYGIWACEHEVKKMKYLRQWSEKQGIEFKDIKSIIKVRTVKERNPGIRINLANFTEYTYVYKNAPETINCFSIGTHHSIDMTLRDSKVSEKREIEEEIKFNYKEWMVIREWYTDPFADSLSLENIKSDEIEEYILSQTPRDFSQIGERRMSAVEYADKYCGVISSENMISGYNEKYKNYNSLGGDCANFASQILHEGGQFSKTYGWNYQKDGSKAWVNAQAFKDFMVYNGRGSKIAYGNYDQVYKASYKLLPGDFIAYEKKGKVTHISVVTGADSKGYTLVNCHNTDRYKVPWDLGWSDKNIKFWLVKMHY